MVNRRNLVVAALALLPSYLWCTPLITITPEGLVSISSADKHASFAAPLNESFRVHVTITTDNERPTEVAIAGLDNFGRISENSSSSIQIVNGTRTSTHTYELELMPTAEGLFALGPAIATYGTTQVESEPITIRVTKDAPRQQGKASSPICSAELEVSKKNPFVWEPLVLTVKISAQKDSVSEVQVNDPTIEGFDVKKMSSAQHQTTLNHQAYVIIENRFLLTPNKSGTRTVGPVTIQYRAQAPHKTNEQFFDDIFNNFFGQGMHGREGHIKASPITINVQPIPAKARDIDGVGTFSQLALRTDKREVTAHEPIKVTLSVTGEGNFDQVEAPKLDLPSSWKVYNSSTKFTPQASDALMQRGTKEFEYIVQIPTVGKIELPVQTFSYFNPLNQQVAHLQTDPVTLTINPRAGEASDLVGPVGTPPVAREEPKNSEASPVETLEGYVEQTDTTPSSIPWTWFILIVLLPLAAGALWFALGWWKRQRTPRKLITRTLQELDHLEAHRSIGGIYSLLTSFCTQGIGAPGQITEEWLFTNLKRIGMTHGSIEQFVEFLNETAGFNFGSMTPRSTDVAALFQHARSWIKKIDSYLNGKGAS